MKLSDDLKQTHVSGDVGENIEGCWERAKEMEDLLMECIKDGYSINAKFRKATVKKLFLYVRNPDNEIDQNDI